MVEWTLDSELILVKGAEFLEKELQKVFWVCEEYF